MKTQYVGLADKFAISTSTLCAMHCIALPFLVSVFPALGATIVSDEIFHLWMLSAVIPFSAVGLVLGCRKHKNFTILGAGVVGLLTLIFAAFFGHDIFGDAGERGATLLGAIIIAWAHLKNFSLCRSSQCEHD
jgi:hypothetical protein